ncbi:quinone oxidoreductase family protein [Paraburkholderia acidipaludis]|uniref:quinone oxidoreductase family protein n=1 Tax=Paraburkholderia acidipaludis TaxID=660537 RepID=UPI00048A38F9|nr:zinc-binding alcohol dehydrogenase family protein [Paraburkholderia acidipaludis]
MKAAIVAAAGQPPVLADFDDPGALEGHRRIDVCASALSVVARSRAAGKHYSSTGAFPFVAGIDGTGRLDNGQRVYFFGPHAPFGALAERTLVPAAQCVPLPEALDDVTAAAIAIPGLSSWAALAERARFEAGETVLVNGATGTSGKLAVQIARHLGARRVIATGRNAASLEALKALGADVTISLQQDEESLVRAFEPLFAQGVDVVLDYLWGTSARALLIAAAQAGAETQSVRFVQIGSISGAGIALPGAVLRAAPITLLGSGMGSVSLARLLDAVRGVFGAVAPAGLRIETLALPLAELEEHWARERSDMRTVFTVGSGW